MDLLPFVHMSPDWGCEKGTGRWGFASWERRCPPRPLCSAMPGKLDPIPATSLRLPRSMEITFVVARLGASLSRRHQDAEKSSRSERRRPRRHQHFIAMRLQQPRQTQRVNTRGQFLCLQDSEASLIALNINKLCRPHLIFTKAKFLHALLGKQRGGDPKVCVP